MYRNNRKRWFNKLLTCVFGRHSCKIIRNIRPPSTTASSDFSNPKQTYTTKCILYSIKCYKFKPYITQQRPHAYLKQVLS